MAQKQIYVVNRAQKKENVMIQMEPHKDYIDNQMKMAQTPDYLSNQNSTDPGLGFYFPETRVATGIDVGMYISP
ncbi:hypothetical protein MHBO_002987 [Bonamia ostreae]|uniref:Uncharacterized protein n=1 Tax=Bonamia ostreae TaxID=126728 RepID=A0ABV2AP57_9EUKA